MEIFSKLPKTIFFQTWLVRKITKSVQITALKDRQRQPISKIPASHPSIREVLRSSRGKHQLAISLKWLGLTAIRSLILLSPDISTIPKITSMVSAKY
jgi:hypothetical protein